MLSKMKNALVGAAAACGALYNAVTDKESLREYGFARKWTRCNCGCKAPAGMDGTTAMAPAWFKAVLYVEDYAHKRGGHCAIEDGEDVKVWHGDRQVRVGDMAAAA